MAAPAKQAAAETRLAALPAPVTAGWTAAPRAAALARLKATGLPVRRDEYWRYTDPARLTAAAPAGGPVPAADEAPMFDGIDRLRLTFVDGVFDPARSGNPALAGVEITRLAEAQGADIHWARDLYGALEARGQSPVERPLAALNTACATDGILIRVTGRAERPVNLVYLQASGASDPILHHIIRLEPGADLTLLEDGPAGARSNIVTEVDLAEGAAFHHIRTQGRDDARLAATHLFARLGPGARFKSFTMTANGKLTRNECVLELTGDNGIAHVAGIALGTGDFVQDDTVFITHDAEHCESRQVFKKVLRNGATGVFQGKILVKQGAQKTDGYQISQALLLDDDAVFLAKPELEIYADDVQCSHGSTSGAIDETALYYLRSRGVPRGQAEDMLVEAFLVEAIGEIDDPAIAAHVAARLGDWLTRQR
jgi:Fe-S cluster assembly protein SufD